MIPAPQPAADLARRQVDHLVRHAGRSGTRLVGWPDRDQLAEQLRAVDHPLLELTVRYDVQGPSLIARRRDAPPSPRAAIWFDMTGPSPDA